MQSPSRWINLSGAVNVRDLGGYKTETGSTRWLNLFRADNLHRLTEEDQSILLDMGIRTIIDLRHRTEVEAAPNIFADHPQILYRNIPIFRQVPSAEQRSRIPDLSAAYRYMVENCKVGFGEALAAIADADAGAVLYHCTAGKDRTGILTALLLSLVGVAPDDIAFDYALTAEAMKRLRPIFLEQLSKMGGSVEETLLLSEAADMAGLLIYIDEQYGNAYKYVQSLGLTDAEISRIRTRLMSSEQVL